MLTHWPRTVFLSVPLNTMLFLWEENVNTGVKGLSVRLNEGTESLNLKEKKAPTTKGSMNAGMELVVFSTYNKVWTTVLENKWNHVLSMVKL